MAGIKVTIKIDTIKKLQDKLSKQGVHAAIDDTVSEVSQMWTDDVHVITGELQSSIGFQTTGYVGRVFATAEHAPYERARPGSKDGTPHDFTLRGIEQGPTLLKEKLEELVSV